MWEMIIRAELLFGSAADFPVVGSVCVLEVYVCHLYHRLGIMVSS